MDFLDTKIGFCQQYAAAMGVMLRKAGVPARVVLGYMHPMPDGNGKFTVTTFDAHAWVEAYFTGIGWVPFDPTPVDGPRRRQQERPVLRAARLPAAANDDRVTKSQTTRPRPARHGRPAPRPPAPTSAGAATAVVRHRVARRCGPRWVCWSRWHWG